MKPIVDAMRRLGWLVDDRSKWVELVEQDLPCAKGEERTEIKWTRSE